MVKRSVSQEGKGRGKVIERESGVETERDREEKGSETEMDREYIYNKYKYIYQ